MDPFKLWQKQWRSSMASFYGLLFNDRLNKGENMHWLELEKTNLELLLDSIFLSSSFVLWCMPSIANYYKKLPEILGTATDLIPQWLPVINRMLESARQTKIRWMGKRNESTIKSAHKVHSANRANAYKRSVGFESQSLSFCEETRWICKGYIFCVYEYFFFKNQNCSLTGIESNKH